MDKHTFIQRVGIEATEYGISDADDLAHNLLEMGVLTLDMPVSQAAQIVAQHVLQA